MTRLINSRHLLLSGVAIASLAACLPIEPGVQIPPTNDTVLIAATGISLPADVKPTCVLSDDTLPESWTTITVPSPTPESVGPVYDTESGLVYVFPPNGPAFTPSSTNTNCSFFKWSAQMFNWLTSSIADSAEQTKAVPTADTPFVFNSEFFYRVMDNTNPPPPSPAKKDAFMLAIQGEDHSSDHVMAVRTRKPPSAEADDSIGQAGGEGVLLSQNFDPSASNLEASFNQSLVYYSKSVNRTYGYFVNEKSSTKPVDFPATAGETCATLQYAQDNGYIDESAISTELLYAYCGDNKNHEVDLLHMTYPEDLTDAGMIAKLEPAVDYLAMAVELKSSWVDLDSIPAANQKRYIQQVSNVPYYQEDDGKWVQKGTAEKTLALVGMHVVGTVKDHPEMVWATYEHMENSPNARYAYEASDGSVKTAQDVSSIPLPGTWTFSNATSELANEETACLKGGDIVAAKATSSTAYTCEPKTESGSVTSIDSTNVVRAMPWGNKPVTETPISVTSEIADTTSLISLNRSVQTALIVNNIDDPRQYYFLSGAVWGLPNAIPTFPSNGSVPASELVGTDLLANSTMETFHQVANGGCFSCHGADTPAASTDKVDGVSVSHIFRNIDPNVPKPQ